MTFTKLVSMTLALALVSTTALANRGKGTPEGTDPERRRQEQERQRQGAPGLNRTSGQGAADAAKSALVGRFVSRIKDGAQNRVASENVAKFFEEARKVEGNKADAFLASLDAVRPSSEQQATDINILEDLVVATAAKGVTVFEVNGVTAEVNGRYDISGWFYQISGMLEKGELPAGLRAALQDTIKNLNKGQTFVDALRNAITKDGAQKDEWARFLRACPFKI